MTTRLTKTIFAEQLSEGDVIHIPATGMTKEKNYRVWQLRVRELVVHTWMYPIQNGNVNTDKVIEKDYGRKVSLEIIK